MAPFSRPFGAEPFGGGNSNITELILRRGDIAAQRALDSGRMWGEAISGIGQAVGGMLAQRQQEKELAKRDAAWSAFIESGTWAEDPQAALVVSSRIWGPKEGPKMAESLFSFRKLSEGQVKSQSEALEELGKVAYGVAKLPDQEIAKFWPALRKAGMGAGTDIGEQYTPEMRPQIEAYAKAYGPAREAKTRSVTTREGGREVTRIVEDIPGQEFVSELETPKSLEAARDAALLSGDKARAAEIQQKIVAFKAQEAAAGRAPQTGPEPPKLGTPEGFILRKYGPNPTPEQEIAGLAEFEAAKKGAAGAGGDALQKAQGAAPLIRRMQGLSDKLITGEGPMQLLGGLARKGKSKLGWDADYKVYDDLRASLASQIAVAQQGGRPSDADVFRSALPLVPDPASDTKESARQKWAQVEDILTAGLTPEGKAQIGLSGNAQPSAPAAPSGYDALPPGTIYKAPDGTMRRKR